MGKNTGNGFRKGMVTSRSQIYNPKTKLHIKRDTSTGRFVSCKKDKFKGVKMEKKS